MDLAIFFGAIAGLAFWNFRLRFSKHRIIISLSIVLLFSTIPLTNYVTWGDKISMIGSIVLAIFYLHRFLSKSSRTFFDYVKLVVVAMLLALFSSFYLGFDFMLSRAWWVFGMAVLPLTACALFYYRILFYSNPMKKKHLVIIISQTVLIFIFLVFAFVQKAAADEARIFAEAQRELAVKNEKAAKEMAQRCEENSNRLQKQLQEQTKKE